MYHYAHLADNCHVHRAGPGVRNCKLSVASGSLTDIKTWHWGIKKSLQRMFGIMVMQSY